MEHLPGIDIHLSQTPTSKVPTPAEQSNYSDWPSLRSRHPHPEQLHPALNTSPPAANHAMDYEHTATQPATANAHLNQRLSSLHAQNVNQPDLSNLRLPATCDPPSEHNPPKQASWIVFGATGHIGRSLVRSILSHGDNCTAVGWTQENTPEQMSQWARSLTTTAHPHPSESTTSPSSPTAPSKPTCLGALCDVRVRSTISSVLDLHLAHFPNIDIIANCTGYGVIGSCEDQDDYDLRNQFSTNFLGTLHIIQLSLPQFRKQGGGRYLIFSSTAGALGVPGLGPYCATKYAVEGLIESMLYEIDVFNIKATLVEPGHVRLDEPDDVNAAQAQAHAQAQGGTGAAQNASTSRTAPTHQATTMGQSYPPSFPQAGTSLSAPVPIPNNPSISSTTAAAAPTSSSDKLPVVPPKPRRYGHFWVKPNPSPPYAPLNSPARHAKRMVQWLNDRQPVSAVKSAELVWQLGHCKYPPLRLLLGRHTSWMNTYRCIQR